MLFFKQKYNPLKINELYLIVNQLVTKYTNFLLYEHPPQVPLRMGLLN